MSRGKIRVVLDLAGIEYIDSSGIGVIVSLFKRVRLLNGDVKLANLSGQPREIFRLLRLDKAFRALRLGRPRGGSIQGRRLTASEAEQQAREPQPLLLQQAMKSSADIRACLKIERSVPIGTSR